MPYAASNAEAKLFSAMYASGPATRPAHAFAKLFARSLNSTNSRFRLFRRYNPANKFVARKRRNVFP